MKISFISAICVLLLATAGNAQSSTNLRFSLLTCGPGTEFIGASFGHNGIRLIDSAAGTDVVYNYGTFDFAAPNFELRFARGTLPYRLATDPTAAFLAEYAHNGRSVREQVLNLSVEEAARLRDLLEENLLPQNREYIYSSVYDNCATRVRDVVRTAVGDDLKWGEARPRKAWHLRKTYRQVFNNHLTAEPWQRFGINILTGMPVDMAMTNEQAMYLPAYLAGGFQGATVSARRLVDENNELLPQRTPLPPPHSPWPVLTVLVPVCAVIIFLVLRGGRGERIAANLFLAATGLLGALMLLMWLGTDHKICENNLNLLWALPTHLVAAFTPVRKRGRYAVVAMALVLLVPLLHALGVQEFPLTELWPLLLALFLVFGSIFRRTRRFVNTPDGATSSNQ